MSGDEIADPIQALVEMGLTDAEARIYCTITHLGEGTAKEIGGASHMERAYTYHVLRRLEKVGLVETTLSSPTRFTSLNPAEAVELLFSLQSSKLDRMKQQKQTIIRNIGYHKGESVKQSEIFSIVTGRTNNRLRAINTIRVCQSEISLLQSPRGLARLWRSTDFLDIIRKKKEEGANVRMITEIVPSNIEAAKEFSSICELRHTRNQVANATLYDRHTCSIVLRIGEDLKSDSREHTSLWTNSKSFVDTMSNFFESVWSIASPYSGRGDSLTASNT